ncbi:hypothetical protein HDU96_003655, partial [Phlyctochytrium bullatum]
MPVPVQGGQQRGMRHRRSRSLLSRLPQPPREQQQEEEEEEYVDVAMEMASMSMEEQDDVEG